MHAHAHGDLVQREEELRAALARLEDALARHERQLPPNGHEPTDSALQALRRGVSLMHEEAQRLRGLLDKA
jgi:hypothetical protein